MISFAILLDVSHAYDVVLASSSFSFSDATVETFFEVLQAASLVIPALPLEQLFYDFYLCGVLSLFLN